MPGIPVSQTATYLSIVGGRFSQKVNKDTPGAVHREYELSNGAKGEKWELVFAKWSGVVRGIEFKDSDYGKVCNVILDDATITLNTDSNFFSDFAKKIFSADLTKSIEFSPYDFESEEGKKLKGITMKQNSNKLYNYFYDAEKKVNLRDFPTAENITEKDDWKVYFLGVKKFLIKRLEWLEFPKVITTIENTPPAEEVKIDDLLPF